MTQLQQTSLVVIMLTVQVIVVGQQLKMTAVYVMVVMLMI
jgi:hypothetical protein